MSFLLVPILTLGTACQDWADLQFDRGVYEPQRLRLSMEGYVTACYHPEWHAWSEIPEWDDLWCEQPLRVALCYARFSGDQVWLERALDVADHFLLAKMQRPDGSVHTLYRAESQEFDHSRVEGPVNGYELGRGQAVFIQQMGDLYAFTGERKYLEAALHCARFVRQQWGKVRIGESPLWAYGQTKDDTYTARVTSLGEAVTAFVELYRYTRDPVWLEEAQALGDVLLHAQCQEKTSVGYGLFSDALFGSGQVDEWWMINSFSKGLQGLADLYRATGEARYRSALEAAAVGFNRAWSQGLGFGEVTRNGIRWAEGGMTSYGIGRLAVPLLKMAHGSNADPWLRLAHRVLAYAWGDNLRRSDHQVPREEGRGGYYFSQTDRRYNAECTFEVLKAQVHRFYLGEVKKSLPRVPIALFPLLRCLGAWRVIRTAEMKRLRSDGERVIMQGKR